MDNCTSHLQNVNMKEYRKCLKFHGTGKWIKLFEYHKWTVNREDVCKTTNPKHVTTVSNLAQKDSPNFSGGALCTSYKYYYYVYLISRIRDSPHLCSYNAQEQYDHMPCHETIVWVIMNDYYNNIYISISHK